MLKMCFRSGRAVKQRDIHPLRWPLSTGRMKYPKSVKDFWPIYFILKFEKSVNRKKMMWNAHINISLSTGSTWFCPLQAYLLIDPPSTKLAEAFVERPGWKLEPNRWDSCHIYLLSGRCIFSVVLLNNSSHYLRGFIHRRWLPDFFHQHYCLRFDIH